MGVGAQLPSPGRAETAIKRRADFKGSSGLERLPVRASGEEKKSQTAPPLARSPPPLSLSLPLRTDRSFDSGSKFALQTGWEAEERCHGKAFLHFKDPEGLPERLSEILRLIIHLLSAQLGL